tara:strand:+ start:41 stop:313 length:273 start_codon:yes stop_codon:yes gene_type:complete
MLKKKFLISLVIVQGLLIIIGIITIIFGVFYKMSNNSNSNIFNKDIELDDIYLINENQYQQRSILDDKAIFQIIDIETNKVLKEIVIENN